MDVIEERKQHEKRLQISADDIAAEFKSIKTEERLPVFRESMNRLILSTRDSVGRALRNRIWLGLRAALVVVVIVVANLAIVLGEEDDGLSEMCQRVTDDSEKFDCHPDRPINESSCRARSCCYVESSDLDVTDEDLINSRYVGVPSCYFPPNYRGYKVIIGETIYLGDNNVSAQYERVTPSGFPGDAKRILLNVTAIDENTLRIKIEDVDSVRYVPDVPVLNLPVQIETNANYIVTFPSSTYLKVKRTESQDAVLSMDLSRLIFSEQFLQLSTIVASEDIYGLGEQEDTMHKSTNWTRYTIFNQGDIPKPNRNLYGTHPFYMVKESGSSAIGVFLLNSNAMDCVLQPTPAVTFRTIGGIFDFYVFLGPNPADVVSQYTALFGRPNFPPRWSLGFQICRYGYFTLDNTKEVLERNLKAGVPIEVQWNDIEYMNRHLDFTYDPTNFAGLPDFVKELHEGGRHYVPIFSPGVSNTEKPGSYEPFDEGKELDLFIKDNDGEYIEGKVWNENTTVFPDFSNPQTAPYWSKQFSNFHEELDFDGVWLDVNEPLNFLNGSNKGCPDTKFDNPPYLPGRPYPLMTLTLCMSAKQYTGEHYYEHNLLAYRETKATYEVIADITSKRPFIISRATFAGQGVYSGHWTGDLVSDWASLQYSVSAMLTFSLYGMPMTGSDICGFRGNTTVELCARWQALGAFYPFSRNHNDVDTIAQDPAALGGDVLKSTLDNLKTRYYLIPYLYTLFYRNYVYGETVARPLFFEFTKDTETYEIEDEFLWGPALLIMPALNPGVTSITPYIPEGIWYDWKTGESRSSKGKRFELKAELTDINLAIRGGYVLPAQQPGMTTTDSAKSPFDFLIALNGKNKAKGELFWDDGETLNTYDDEKFNLIEIDANKNVINFNAKINDDTIKMDLGIIRVYGLKESPSDVTINKSPVSYEFKENELRINGTTFSLLDNLTVEWQ